RRSRRRGKNPGRFGSRRRQSSLSHSQRHTRNAGGRVDLGRGPTVREQSQAITGLAFPLPGTLWVKRTLSFSTPQFFPRTDSLAHKRRAAIRGKIESVEVHHSIPRGYEVVQELLLSVLRTVNFRQGPELGVRTEDEINTRGGPFEFTRSAVAAFKGVGVFGDRLPLRAHVEKVHKEIIGQGFGSSGEDAMPGFSEVGIQNTQTAEQHRHLGCGQGQQLRLVDQKRFGGYVVAGLLVVTEAVRDW